DVGGGGGKKPRGGDENGTGRPSGRPVERGSATLVDGLHRAVAARAVHGGVDRQNAAVRRERPYGLPRHRLLALIGLLRARMGHAQPIALEGRAGHDVAAVTLLDLVATIAHDRVGTRAWP